MNIALQLNEIEELLSIIEAQAQQQQPIGIEARAKKAKEVLKRMKEALHVKGGFEMKGKKVFMVGIEQILCKTENAEKVLTEAMKEVYCKLKELEKAGELEVVDYTTDYSFNDTRNAIYFVDQKYKKQLQVERFMRFDVVENYLENSTYSEASRKLKMITYEKELQKQKEEEANNV